MMLVREWRQATRYYPKAGYDVGQSGGRPHGSTWRLAMMLVRVEAGHTVPTREASYDVDQSGGRPHSTYPRGWL